MPTLIAMENVEFALCEMLTKYGGGRRVGMQTEILHHLGIAVQLCQLKAPFEQIAGQPKEHPRRRRLLTP